MDIPVLTVAGFRQMQEQVAKASQGVTGLLGVSVALWRLQALMEGYQYALDHGFTTGVTVEETTQEEAQA